MMTVRRRRNRKKLRQKTQIVQKCGKILAQKRPSDNVFAFSFRKHSRIGHIKDKFQNVTFLKKSELTSQKILDYFQKI